MGKTLNKRGKHGHSKKFTKETDRSKHWRYGKTSGKKDYQARQENKETE